MTLRKGEGLLKPSRVPSYGGRRFDQIVLQLL